MKNFKILIPCFNDWKSLFKLLDNIDLQIKEINAEFSVLVVNDCSSEEMPTLKKNYKKIKSIDLVNIKKNQGHTRCFATGIKYISQNPNFDYLLLMDGDGEDRPEELPLLINTVLKKQNVSVVAARTKRSEGIIFKFLYQFHKILTLIFTGRNMNFGHYSCLTKDDTILISNKKSLWSNFAGTAKKFINNLDSVPTERGYRYFGPSKMPLVGLVIHSLSIIATFKYKVLLRSFVLAIIFNLIFFITNQNIILLVFNFLISIFCLIIFIVSKKENAEELDTCLTRIKNVINIHTIRL